MGATVDVAAHHVAIALDEALQWLQGAVLAGEAEPTIAFFDLSPQAQVLAVDALRSSARGAISAGGLDAPSVIDTVSDSHRRWLGPASQAQ